MTLPSQLPHRDNDGRSPLLPNEVLADAARKAEAERIAAEIEAEAERRAMAEFLDLDEMAPSRDYESEAELFMLALCVVAVAALLMVSHLGWL